jgi:uncharacterized membrane protein YdjX (TVP38/TMEM64 family)
VTRPDDEARPDESSNDGRPAAEGDPAQPSATSAPAEGGGAASAGTEESLGTVLRRLGPVGILAGVWAALPGIMGIVLIVRYLDDVSAWLQAQGSMGLVIFIGGFMVSAGFGLLPTYAQAVLAGWVFGAALGIPAALAGFTGAALVGFVIARTVSGERVERLVADHPRAAVVRSALIGRGFLPTLGIVSLVRLPPNSPFSLTNLLLAGTGVRLGPYLVGTVIGMTPRTAIVAALAAAAAASGSADIVDFVAEKRNRWMFIGGLVATVIVLAVIGRIANRALERFAEGSAGAPARNGTP